MPQGRGAAQRRRNPRQSRRDRLEIMYGTAAKHLGPDRVARELGKAGDRAAYRLRELYEEACRVRNERREDA